MPVYDAAERGDFTDPQTRLSWFQTETRRLQGLTIRQLKALVRLGLAELRRRDVEIRGDDERGPTGLAMGLMFCAGALSATLVVLSICQAVYS